MCEGDDLRPECGRTFAAIDRRLQSGDEALQEHADSISRMAVSVETMGSEMADLCTLMRGNGVDGVVTEIAVLKEQVAANTAVRRWGMRVISANVGKLALLFLAFLGIDFGRDAVREKVQPVSIEQAVPAVETKEAPATPAPLDELGEELLQLGGN